MANRKLFGRILFKKFEFLKKSIGSTPILAIPDFDRPFHMRMDASDFAIGGVLFQEEGEGTLRVERPVAFGGRKYKDAEKNYSIREKKLLAILFGVRLWRVYLLDKPFIVETDHPTENAVADGISRRPDFAGSKSVTLASISIRQHIRRGVKRDLVSLVNEAVGRYGEDPFTATVQQLLIGNSTTTKLSIRHIQRYSLVNKQILYQTQNDEQPRLVLPNSCEIIDAVLYEFHDAKCYGHPGVERTLRLVEPHYYWRSMEKSIRVYVSSCEVCQRIKSRTTKPPGLLRSHPIPSARWTHLAMGFIVAMPKTTSGFGAIMIVIDRLSKRAHFIPTTTTATALETAQLYRDREFVLHGLPEEVLSDRDSKFTSDLWTTLCEMLVTRQELTAAFRQQANGIMERVNQTIENFLRAFSNSNCDDWDTMLSLAEFAYNSRYQASIKMSPFQADLGYLPSSQDKMRRIYAKNRPIQEFKIGDRVLLSTTNLATFHAVRVGHDYNQLELPTRVKLHPIFHTSSLKPYVASSRGDQTLFKGELVEDIVGYRKRKGKKEYQVKWIGQVELTWEPLKNLEYILDLVNRYHQTQRSRKKTRQYHR
ncbi:Gag-pol [Phytophthora palmivora]|uniref:Gag-pol n=1 Tax=Phytophthora palmivora TaxID=4796 RepID=A0A2P4XKY0_9STRA|nr:Gag-pol [Phytophthora palmivora]